MQNYEKHALRVPQVIAAVSKVSYKHGFWRVARVNKKSGKVVLRDTTFPDFVLCHASTLPSGNAERKIKRTSGPATISWKGRAMIKFFGMLVIQIISS